MMITLSMDRKSRLPRGAEIIFAFVCFAFPAICSIGLNVTLRAQTLSNYQADGLIAQDFCIEPDTWRFWGANVFDSHSSFFEHRLNPQDVSGLTTKWIFTTSGDVSATPTVEGNALYVPDWGGYLYKLNTGSGAVIWKIKISDYTGNASGSRTSPAIAKDKIIIGDRGSGTILAIDKISGALVWKTVVDPLPAAIITSSPIVIGNRVYAGVSSSEEYQSLRPGYVLSFRGNVNALDLDTGAIIWKTYTVPEGYTGGSVWGSSFAVDFKRGSLYVTSANNYSIPADAAACQKNAPTKEDQRACLDPNDYFDSVLSLDLETGRIKWGTRMESSDTYTYAHPDGPDYGFGSGANYFTIVRDGQFFDLVGAGEKSGVYRALDAETGEIIWATQVGPGSRSGGIIWGSATDGQRIYTAVNDGDHIPYTLGPGNVVTTNAGSWAALDPATGKIIWQIPATGQNPLNPSFGAGAQGQVSAANGVVYAGSLSGDMVAIEATSGKILWKFASGGSVVCGPSIVNGSLYWGSGYRRSGTPNNKLYSFTVR